MLDVVAAIFLFLLPLRVNGLITTDAKCLAGYEWVRTAFKKNSQLWYPSFSDIQLDRPKPMRHRSGTCISLRSGWT